MDDRQQQHMFHLHFIQKIKRMTQKDSVCAMKDLNIKRIHPVQDNAKPQSSASLNAESAEEDHGVCFNLGLLAAYIVIGCVVLAGGILVVAVYILIVCVMVLFVLVFFTLPYAINYIYCLDKACKSPIWVQKHTGEVASNA